MNREVHVRFWESPEVKVLRATRQSATPSFATGMKELASIPDTSGANCWLRQAVAAIGGRPRHLGDGCSTTTGRRG
jgi:hypothetical protein